MGNPDLEAKIAAIPFWYHCIALPDGVTTPGTHPINAEIYDIPARLDGLRVLDIGAWDGFWTFEALKRGAREVTAIDDFSDFLGKDVERRAWDSFDLCRAALGYDEQRCRRQEMTVYDLSPETLGHFDIVFCFGTLYHLRYPLLALDRIASVAEDRLFVESAILDDYSPYNGGLGHGYPGRQMVMEFYPGRNYGNNATNWWVPTLNCLANMVIAAGFGRDVEAWKLFDAPTAVYECRGFVSGRKAV